MVEEYKLEGVSVKKYSPEKSSDKPPVIMVHGGNHAGWCWHNWARFFSEVGYEVHVLDWYNHGDSDALPTDEFIKRSIKDVAKQEITYISDELGRAPILMGHSMGGLASATYAAMAPVEKLVLIAPVVPKSVHSEPIPVPIDMSQPFPPFPYEQAKQLFFTKSSDEDARKYFDRLDLESPRDVYEATRLDAELDISVITVPTFVMAAEFDQLYSPEPLERYATMLNAKFTIVEGIGHSDILLKEPECRIAANQIYQWLEEQ